MRNVNFSSMNITRQIEEISANAWAAPFATFHDGWLLRYANGYTRRANSVLPLYRSVEKIEHKLSFVESFYNQRALPTFFKMTHAAEPRDLDAYLAEQGYSVVGRTSVQTLSINHLVIDPELKHDEMDVRTYPSQNWLNTFFNMNNIRPMYHLLVREMLTEHLLQKANFVLLWENTTPIGTAMLVVERGYAGIFDVVVHPDYRAQGYGRKLMEYMVWLAQVNQAHTVYLQVMLNNERALRLYEKLGFSENYQYWYREKPLPVK